MTWGINVPPRHMAHEWNRSGRSKKTGGYLDEAGVSQLSGIGRTRPGPTRFSRLPVNDLVPFQPFSPNTKVCDAETRAVPTYCAYCLSR